VSIIHDNIELTRRRRAYAIRVATLSESMVSYGSPLFAMGGATNLFPHLPQALQTAEHVAAPQQLAAKPKTVPMLGTARSGSDRSAPMVTACRGLGYSLRGIAGVGSEPGFKIVDDRMC